MPRQARLDGPGLLHHVIARGIERRAIFLDKTDYADFLSRIESAYFKSPNQILAWALMPNHFHMLIRTGTGGLSRFMRRLMSGYAVAFNSRHRRSGYLFQNRYKSIVCEEDPYFKELVRYIHLNPFRAGIVRSIDALARFPYSGHSALMGIVNRPGRRPGRSFGTSRHEIAMNGLSGMAGDKGAGPSWWAAVLFEAREGRRLPLGNAGTEIGNLLTPAFWAAEISSRRCFAKPSPNSPCNLP